MMKYIKFLNLLFLLSMFSLTAQEINLNWEPREDLNINLPASIKVFDAVGTLPDGKPIRAMYALVDLNDENLVLRSLGSNTIRESTKKTYERGNGILAINGGYFATNTSVSTIIQDGEVIASGPNGSFTRGAFGIQNGIPEIAWVRADSSSGIPMEFAVPDVTSDSEVWDVSQGVGGGPVLLKDGEIHLTDREEGFGGSHLQRHPRTSVGYKDKNTLIMMVVDGRQEASAGVTLPELASLMRSTGAIEAINLDGGGSSAMVAANEVVNIPTDITGGNRNSLRKNAGALVISEIQPSQFPQPIVLDTENENYWEAGIWKTANLVNYYGETASRMSTSNDINKAYYSFKGLQRNAYQLAAWFSVNTGENAEIVNYILHSKDGSDTLRVDQTSLENSGKWNVLGHFEISPEDSLEIRGASHGKFTADAIRLVAKKDSPELPKRGDFRIAVLSDLNSGLGAADYQWQVDSIINRIPKIWKPDLVICGGDMVAGMGISDTGQLEKMWEGFDTHIAQPLKKAGIPFAFTLGNHDGPRSYPVERDFAKEFWNNNKNKPKLNFVDDTHFPNYYSFVAQDNFFVSWEASSSKITPENLEWLEQQFETPEAKNARFRFVMGHMPLYSVAQERDSKGNVLEEPEKLRRLLEKNKVHTYISGHQHAYYPGKRGELELLNTGAAGSGPRAWLTQNRKPVNTLTIMDVFQKKDSIIYSTYDIKTQEAAEMPLFDQRTLPSAMFGVNGHLMRRDIQGAKTAKGFLSSMHAQGAYIPGIGHVKAEILGDQLQISGEYFNLDGLSKKNTVGIYQGRHTETGELIKALKIVDSANGSGSFKGRIKLTDDVEDFLAIGGLYLQINTRSGNLRTQLYPEENKAPKPAKITSHQSRNSYGVRNIEALYEVEWEPSVDKDGDFVSYMYQLSKSKDFTDLVLQEKTGRETGLKMTEQQWFDLLGSADMGQQFRFYHRIIASDGSNISISIPIELKLMKSGEPLDDLAEIPAPNYIFKGKVGNSGAGYGAAWDNEGKLWMADYNRGFTIKDSKDQEVAFSPLTSVEISGEVYQLHPVNGMGVDQDGNILAGINRRLIKIDARTGKGIAIWEVPEGGRAITAPRATENGEIYAMSLFGEDPNYVLKQQGKSFELLRTLELEDRKLSRTFEMTSDGKKLYFPLPGSPKIEVYSSKDGEKYKKEKDISSISAGSSAIRVIGNSIYAAVRSSGISPSTFHYRNEEKKQMWTLELPEVNGAEPRGIGVSKDGNTLIFCSWDKGGGYYLFEKKQD